MVEISLNSFAIDKMDGNIEMVKYKHANEYI